MAHCNFCGISEHSIKCELLMASTDTFTHDHDDESIHSCQHVVYICMECCKSFINDHDHSHLNDEALEEFLDGK